MPNAASTAVNTERLTGPARDDMRVRAWELRGAKTRVGVAEHLGLSPSIVAHLWKEGRERGWHAVASQAQQGAGERANGRSQGSVPGEYVFTGVHQATVNIPLYTGHPVITGDAVVVGDVHFPTTNFEWCDTMLDTAQRLNLRRLVIVGDLLNVDAFSKYDQRVPLPDFDTEVDHAQGMIHKWGAWFDEMVMVLGNHEDRLLKYLRGQFKTSWLARILDAGGDKLRIYPYSHIVIKSGGVEWRCTHQLNYSRIKGRIGNQLAQKFQSNVICFHQHHVSKIRDDFNRYTVVDGGGLFDPDKMAYVRLVDSTSPEMSNGFVLLVDGVAHLVTPYPDYTDLDVLVGGLTMKRALAPRVARGG